MESVKKPSHGVEVTKYFRFTEEELTAVMKELFQGRESKNIIIRKAMATSSSNKDLASF